VTYALPAHLWLPQRRGLARTTQNTGDVVSPAFGSGVGRPEENKHHNRRADGLTACWALAGLILVRSRRGAHLEMSGRGREGRGRSPRPGPAPRGEVRPVQVRGVAVRVPVCHSRLWTTQE